MDGIQSKPYVFLYRGIGKNEKESISMLPPKQKQCFQDYRKKANEILYAEGNASWTANQKPEKYMQLESWVYSFTLDLVIYHTYKEWNIEPACMAGYSMGLITAAVSTGSITYEDGVHMLKTIYEYLFLNLEQYDAMGTIIGLDCTKIQDIIQRSGVGEQVKVASENNEYCIVIAGHKNEVNQILNICEKYEDTKTIVIDSDFAFHTDFAKKGIEKLEKLVKAIDFQDCHTPILSVYDQAIIREGSMLRDEIIKNMSTPMKWKQSILEAERIYAPVFIDVSLSDAITRMSKLVTSSSAFYSYKEIQDMNIWKE